MNATLPSAQSRALVAHFAGCLVVGIAAQTGWARGYQTTNFEVSAPTAALAREIGEAAEKYRKQLAIEWLGRPMPPWSERCPIKAKVSPKLGAGGATSFLFDRGEVFGWRMTIQGSRERVLDSVLPHEITHTIFATHFRQPLPRWADEGACTTVEHPSEINRMKKMLITFLKTKKGIPFSDLMRMKEYPPEMLPLYAEGHALAEFLIGQQGKRAFLKFLEDGLSDENWPRAIREHYGYANLMSLQNEWLTWVKQGRPPLTAGSDQLIAAASTASRNAAGGQVRGQSPDSGRGMVPVQNASRQSPRHAPSHLTRPVARSAAVASSPPANETNAAVAAHPASVAAATECEGEVCPLPSDTEPDRIVFQWTRPEIPGRVLQAATATDTVRR